MSEIRVRSKVWLEVDGQAFLWAHCQWQADGYQVEIPQRQGSGQTRSVQGANALLSIPIDSPDLAPGSQVEIIQLDVF